MAVDEPQGPVVAVVPAYEEQARVGAVVRSIHEALPDALVCVVDDGSLDETAEAARAAGADAVCRLPFNLGYGAALQTGYKWAAERGARAVVQCDADGQHDPSQLPRLLARLDGADVVIGSRFLARDGHYRATAGRAAAIRLYRGLVRLTTGLRMTDPTSGFQALSGPVIAHCASGHMATDYPDADQIIELHRTGFTIVEEPVTMRAREGGSSMHGRALSPRAAWYAFKVTLSIGVTLLRRPMKKDTDGPS